MGCLPQRGNRLCPHDPQCLAHPSSSPSLRISVHFVHFSTPFWKSLTSWSCSCFWQLFSYWHSHIPHPSISVPSLGISMHFMHFFHTHLEIHFSQGNLRKSNLFSFFLYQLHPPCSCSLYETFWTITSCHPNLLSIPHQHSLFVFLPRHFTFPWLQSTLLLSALKARH